MNEVERPSHGETNVMAIVELTDGSRLRGMASIDRLPMALDFADLGIPLKYIESFERGSSEGVARITLTNGDILTGSLLRQNFPFQTVLGELCPPFELIDNIRFEIAVSKALPAGEGSLSFGDFNWVGWRTGFEIQGDRLATLPGAAEGFRYGHGGHGRNAMLYTNIGSREWVDYRAEFTFCIGYVNPAFNPHGLPLSHRVGYIRFRVADARESWNEIGRSSYTLGLQANGDWSLSRSLNGHTPSAVGYSTWVSEGSKILASGEGLMTDPENGNRYILEVKGDRITIYVDGELLVDVEDPDMDKEYSGVSLGYGGIGFEWLWESMGWISDFSAEGI